MPKPDAIRGSRNRSAAGALLLALFSTACFKHHCPVSSSTVEVDPLGGGVLEPGKAAAIEPAWRYHFQVAGSGCASNNPCPTSALVDGNLTSFDGPAGGVYTILDGAADYGSISLNTTSSCSATGDCYAVSVTAPGGRPSPHWDTTLSETVSSGDAVTSPTSWIIPIGASALAPESCPVLYGSRVWTLHVGKSFLDVPTDGFYPSIENLFHNGITAGCDVNQYCPGSSIRREQMAVFLLKSINGPAYVPPPCGGAFSDVPCPGPFSDWVEDIHNQGIVADCGGGNFCPKDSVTRRDMAQWLLKAHDGAAYAPPPATGLFADVPAGDADADWIEELYRRQLTAGCNASPLLFCPDRPNTRAQMAVFVVKTWGMRMY